MAGGHDDETADGALQRTFVSTFIGAIVFCAAMFFILV